jgi:hypothetical protein
MTKKSFSMRVQHAFIQSLYNSVYNGNRLIFHLRNAVRRVESMARYLDGETVPARKRRAYIEDARAQYAEGGNSDDIVIDDDARVSVGDGEGAFVQAWLWVYDDDGE